MSKGRGSHDPKVLSIFFPTLARGEDHRACKPHTATWGCRSTHKNHQSLDIYAAIYKACKKRTNMEPRLSSWLPGVFSGFPFPLVQSPATSSSALPPSPPSAAPSAPPSAPSWPPDGPLPGAGTLPWPPSPDWPAWSWFPQVAGAWRQGRGAGRSAGTTGPAKPWYLGMSSSILVFCRYLQCWSKEPSTSNYINVLSVTDPHADLV